MSILIDTTYANSERIIKILGEKLRNIRLSRNLSQEQMAIEAGIGKSTLRRLEDGESISLDNFIRILIALGIQQNLETLLPDPTVRPMERIRLNGRERQRARPVTPAPEATAWVWGDEEDTDGE